MKKIVLLLIGLILVTSCQMTEEVTFEKNGSGTYMFNIDMGQMMAMANDIGKKNDSLKVNKKPEIKDTVILVSDILEKNKDSIKNLSKEEKEALYDLKDSKIHIDMDETKGKMLMQYIIPFKNINDLSNINDKLKKLSSIDPKNKNNNNNGIMEDMKMPPVKITYKFNKRKFHRIVTPAPKPKDSIRKDDKMQQMLGMFRYKLVYHFPYKIKSVSYKNALLTADGKTLIIEMPIDSLIAQPKLLDFEVKFE